MTVYLFLLCTIALGSYYCEIISRSFFEISTALALKANEDLVRLTDKIYIFFTLYLNFIKLKCEQ